jgi:hypothetical protein
MNQNIYSVMQEKAQAVAASASAAQILGLLYDAARAAA